MELWLQWIYPAIGILVTIGILRSTFRKRLDSGWRRVLLRITGVVFSIPFALVTLVFLFMIGCDFNGPLVGSPDRQHVARVQITDAGALGGSASVAVRRSWYPIWTNAYMGLGLHGRDGTLEPKVKWIDNSHLLITFPAGGEDPISCHQNVGDVQVKCEIEEMSK